jgi:hypothetical protein
MDTIKEVAMKSSMFIIAAFVTLTISGCQENNVTDPAAMAQLQANNLSKAAMESTKPAPRPETIQISATVKDPTKGSNTFIAIQGEVAYRMFQKERPGNNFELRLQTDAELSPTDKDVTSWRVSQQSIDLIYVSEEGVTWLNKVYKVDGVKDGLSLGLRFQITQFSVELVGVWLQKPPAAVDSGTR